MKDLKIKPYRRRSFIKLSAAGLGALTFPFPKTSDHRLFSKPNGPVIISTWNHGLAANAEAWKILHSGGSLTDAVEAGVKIPESDPKNHSVGKGGYPDRDGKVTLDACIMNEKGRCGSVMFLEHIENPISVARKVMENTPHIVLAGEGALQFALENGFEKTDLLTDESRKAWQEWLKKSEYKPVINIENHDTIGLLALDENGNMAGACTTSGAAWKIHGRVGDSPIIGAGMFMDNEVGGACATGLGEEVIRVAGSAMIVELMRQGSTPDEACKEVIRRILRYNPDTTNLQVGFLALAKDGTYGSAAIQPGFNFALHTSDKAEMIEVMAY